MALEGQAGRSEAGKRQGYGQFQLNNWFNIVIGWLCPLADSTSQTVRRRQYVAVFNMPLYSDTYHPDV